MLLGEVDAEEFFDHRSETNPGETGEAGAEFGVEQACGIEADLAQAGQVLAGGVEDPLFLADDVVELRERSDGRRVEQERAGSASEDLDEVGALRIPEPGRTLCVNGDRSRARSNSRNSSEVILTGIDNKHRRVGGLFGLGRRNYFRTTHVQLGAQTTGSLPRWPVVARPTCTTVRSSLPHVRRLRRRWASMRP